MQLLFLAPGELTLYAVAILAPAEQDRGGHFPNDLQFSRARFCHVCTFMF